MTALGIAVPTSGSLPSTLGIDTMARIAEEFGADTIWVGDHLLSVRGASSPYAFRDLPPPEEDTPWYEAITTLTWIAATVGCRVATGVLILPQRDSLVLAKVLATLDVLSGGRLSVGIGTGWSAEEMAALGFDWSTRGERCDEAIMLLRNCWSSGEAPFVGRFLRRPAGSVMRPVPIQAGGPPILVSGIGSRQLRRAGSLGDGWIAPARAVDGVEVEGLRTVRAVVDQHRARAGRSSLPFHAVAHLRGPRADLGAEVNAAADLVRAGFDEVRFMPAWDDLAHAKRQIDALRKVLAP